MLTLIRLTMNLDFIEILRLRDYDTIPVECGYWNLTKQNDRIENYYQFYLHEKPIVAKGF